LINIAARLYDKVVLQLRLRAIPDQSTPGQTSS
jgi:hypothetical protein